MALQEQAGYPRSFGYRLVDASFLHRQSNYLTHWEHAQVLPALKPLRHTIGWPLEISILRHPATRITAFHSDVLPGLALQTPPGITATIISPDDTTLEDISLQSSGLYTVTLAANNSRLMYKIRHLSSLTLPLQDILEKYHEGFVPPSPAVEFGVGEAIGQLDVNQTPNIVELQIAHQVHRRSIQIYRTELVDPLPLLYKLY